MGNEGGYLFISRLKYIIKEASGNNPSIVFLADSSNGASGIGTCEGHSLLHVAASHIRIDQNIIFEFANFNGTLLSLILCEAYHIRNLSFVHEVSKSSMDLQNIPQAYGRELKEFMRIHEYEALRLVGRRSNLHQTKLAVIAKVLNFCSMRLAFSRFISCIIHHYLQRKTILPCKIEDQSTEGNFHKSSHTFQVMFFLICKR
jgi:hypothetical protein